MGSAPWFPLPVRLTDEVMPRLKDTEMRVILVVLRQTAGWRADRSAADGEKDGGRRKGRDWLSHRQLCRRTGRGSAAVSAAVASLAKSGLLVVEDVAGRPLPTPEQRRRHLGRLYFRPGEALKSAACGSVTLACGNVENPAPPPYAKSVNDNRTYI